MTFICLVPVSTCWAALTTHANADWPYSQCSERGWVNNVWMLEIPSQSMAWFESTCCSASTTASRQSFLLCRPFAKYMGSTSGAWHWTMIPGNPGNIIICRPLCLIQWKQLSCVPKWLQQDRLCVEMRHTKCFPWLSSWMDLRQLMLRLVHAYQLLVFNSHAYGTMFKLEAP